MKMPAVRRQREVPLPGISAVARVDKRTKNLTKRLRPGEIAVIDHLDLDRVSAEALVAHRPAAVVNASASISGRYPNLGPEIVVAAGIPLVDEVGPDVLSRVHEGEVVRLDDNVIYRGEVPLAYGTLQNKEAITAAMEEARAGLSVQLEAFAANTMEYLKRERELLLDGVGVPAIDTKLEGKHALIVVRGYNYREDIAALRPYLREYRPVMIGVDGGADALVEAGYRPDIIVGDMDSVSDAVLRSGAELVVHAYRDGSAPGRARLDQLGLPCVTFPAAGTSEDIAMLLADDAGASLIVAVGSHATLVEFLDKGRAGMASTFLTRLRVGGKLVDAKGVSRLYRSSISTGQLLLLVGAAIAVVAVAFGVSPAGRAIVSVLAALWQNVLYWFQGLF
ncbi:MAG: putative cytokinetic ring protein SteA [Sporichthyaceae bacterium]|nr:putative cytokinetic ring protein SteA [Sporichthyaceae bacterium]